MPHAVPPSFSPNTPELDCLDFSGKTTYGDFRDDLVRDGYAIVKHAVPPEKANHYVDEIQTWLEGFGLGYKRDDPSTVREECLPVISAKGIVQAYGASHESFTWGTRSEPGVVGAFEKILQTDDLIVSFDAVNVSLAGRRDQKYEEWKPWAHQDQDPERPGFRCIQGLVNLCSNGDNDGGLMALKGGHLVSQEYHKTFQDEEHDYRWTNEIYFFKDTGLKWLADRGLEWVKVNAEPGDLIVWDSRTPHYNVPPRGAQNRFVVYTSYAPVSTATQEDLLRKKALFEDSKGHSHWAQASQPFVDERIMPLRNGHPDPLNTWKPRKPPILTERAFKLTGIPYITNGQ